MKQGQRKNILDIILASLVTFSKLYFTPISYVEAGTKSATLGFKKMHFQVLVLVAKACRRMLRGKKAAEKSRLLHIKAGMAVDQCSRQVDSIWG
jgi:hypothetical protein